MTTATEMRGALAAIDQVLGQGVEACAGNAEPYTALVGVIDQVRATVRDMAGQVTEEPALCCSACIQDARNAEAAGLPLPPVLRAVMVVNGNSWCDVRHRIATAAQVAAAQSSRILLPGQLPPMNGHGG